MATYTSTTFANYPAKSVHVGQMSVSGQYSYGAQASSAGDVIFLCKLPTGAVVTEVQENHTTGATAQGVSIGLATGGAAGGGASFSAYIASGAQATINRINVLGPTFATSVSDLDPNRYAVLAAKVESGSATTSLQINWTVNYRVDQPNPP